MFSGLQPTNSLTHGLLLAHFWSFSPASLFPWYQTRWAGCLLPFTWSPSRCAMPSLTSPHALAMCLEGQKYPRGGWMSKPGLYRECIASFMLSIPVSFTSPQITNIFLTVKHHQFLYNARFENMLIVLVPAWLIYHGEIWTEWELWICLHTISFARNTDLNIEKCTWLNGAL